jgi:hypothetical protein
MQRDGAAPVLAANRLTAHATARVSDMGNLAESRAGMTTRSCAKWLLSRHSRIGVAENPAIMTALARFTPGAGARESGRFALWESAVIRGFEVTALLGPRGLTRNSRRRRA